MALTPVAVGLVTNIDRPGGNVIGMTFPSSELTAKQVQSVARTQVKVGFLTIAADRYPLSPRIRKLRAILDKLRAILDKLRAILDKLAPPTPRPEPTRRRSL
jgi:hypothetical protein